MDHIENHLEEQVACWNFFETLPYVKRTEVVKNLPKTTQLIQPLFEFSGACAGCGETPYVKLLTQLFGDRMVVANATGCSSIYSGNLPTTPYAKDEKGHGPAWANSLFEDNAEFGLGMRFSIDQQTHFAKTLLEGLKDKIGAELVEKILANPQATDVEIDDQRANVKALREKLAGIDTPEAKHLNKLADYLIKKSVWILGGDGWAYDIGFGGLDHVIASGENVNILVFDTEVYSNTGGQASKASNIGQVAQFAAAGKETKKKSLSEIAMSYGYVYVAQVAMGANPAQTIKAITEAEAYHGPSLIIGYAPCEMHSIKGGMTNCQAEMKKAVECGYWNLFRFDPSKETGKFQLDSKAPKDGYQEFLMNEARYSRLTREFPERATDLFAKNEAAAKERWEHLNKLVEMYKD